MTSAEAKRDVVLAALENHANTYHYLPDYLQADREILLAACNAKAGGGISWHRIPKSLRDKEIAYAYIARNYFEPQMIDDIPELSTDVEFARQAFHRFHSPIELCRFDGNIIDKEFTLSVLNDMEANSYNTYDILQALPPAVAYDEDVINKLLDLNPYLFAQMPPEIQNNKELYLKKVLPRVGTYYAGHQTLPTADYLNDKDVVMATLQQAIANNQRYKNSGFITNNQRYKISDLLKLIPDELWEDPEIVKLSVQLCPNDPILKALAKQYEDKAEREWNQR